MITKSSRKKILNFGHAVMAGMYKQRPFFTKHNNILILFATGILATMIIAPGAFSSQKASNAKAPILDPEVLRSTADLTAMKDRHFVESLSVTA